MSGVQILTCFENMAKAICIERGNSSNVQKELRFPVELSQLPLGAAVYRKSSCVDIKDALVVTSTFYVSSKHKVSCFQSPHV